jgi:hypothetical protein
MTMPRRAGFCLQCRTALMSGEACDQGGEHTALTLDDVYSREALIAAVWGPVRVRREQLVATYRAQQSLASVTVVGAAAGMLASTLFLPFVGATAAVLSGVASGSVFWALGKRALRKNEHVYPVGAEPLQFASALRRGRRGQVAGELALVSPASATECLAYAVELHYEGHWGDRVMYRDAVTAAMTVELEGGGRARVPAGRIRLVGVMHQEIDVDNVMLERHLLGFDPQRSPDSAFDPLRYNVVYEQVIVPGDRVELVSEFQPTINLEAEPTHYRESAPSVLVPRGVPVVRRWSD